MRRNDHFTSGCIPKLGCMSDMFESMCKSRGGSVNLDFIRFGRAYVAQLGTLILHGRIQMKLFSFCCITRLQSLSWKFHELPDDGSPEWSSIAQAARRPAICMEIRAPRSWYGNTFSPTCLLLVYFYFFHYCFFIFFSHCRYSFPSVHRTVTTHRNETTNSESPERTLRSWRLNFIFDLPVCSPLPLSPSKLNVSTFSSPHSVPLSVTSDRHFHVRFHFTKLPSFQLYCFSISDIWLPPHLLSAAVGILFVFVLLILMQLSLWMSLKRKSAFSLNLLIARGLPETRQRRSSLLEVVSTWKAVSSCTYREQKTTVHFRFFRIWKKTFVTKLREGLQRLDRNRYRKRF